MTNVPAPAPRHAPINRHRWSDDQPSLSTEALARSFWCREVRNFSSHGP